MSRRLRSVEYRVDGDRKTVAFWTMQHRRGSFVPGDEVDEVRWLPPDEARGLLSHDVERGVLDDFSALPRADAVVVLVRHAKAGRRSEWRGDDALRPLDEAGTHQAQRLSAFLRFFAPERVLSATPERCVRTVAPLAAELGVEVIVDPVFSDDDWAGTPAATEAALLALGRPGSANVVCSQGGAIPALVDALAPWSGPTDTKKGAAWVLSFVDGAVLAADYYPHAAR